MSAVLVMGDASASASTNTSPALEVIGHSSLHGMAEAINPAPGISASAPVSVSTDGEAVLVERKLAIPRHWPPPRPALPLVLPRPSSRACHRFHAAAIRTDGWVVVRLSAWLRSVEQFSFLVFQTGW
ncbi:MAG: hypothetical protein FWD63_09155 [Propionibacteriaceae bacterium]|nr:hypothetical protein [Propionibacteriaceae bacterium]